MSVKQYKLTIAYEGTEFGGWQVQPNAISIQQKLQEAFKIITREDVPVTGSGRTDAGVHALAQVAHVPLKKTIDCYKTRASLNGLLPKAIRVLHIEEVSTDFHARYSAKRKCYHYHIDLDPVQLPFNRLYSWHIRGDFSIEGLQQAAKHFVGEHDFTSFANEAHQGSAANNPVRTLYRLDVFEKENGIRLEFEANGFLYKMVRNIVGTLVEVGKGKLSPDQIPQILKEKRRCSAGQAAPPQGLFLAFVDYPIASSSNRSEKEE